MFLLAHVSAALACTPTVSFSGFDPWLEEGVGVPTDARIVIRAEGGSFDVVLTRVDTSEAQATTQVGDLGVSEGETRVAFAPDAALAPATTYRVDVISDASTPGEIVGTTTFETGAGPSPTAFDAPVVTSLAGSAWADDDQSLFYCIIGNPVVVRGVEAEVTVPSGLPPGAYLGFHSAARPEDFEHVEPIGAETALAPSFLQAEFESPSAARDCLTPVVVLPSGAEIAGEEVCVAEDGIGLPVDCGCSSSSGAPLGAVVFLALAGVRRRRA
jgi:MYXO-CTERM domain-containing protein